MLAHSSIRQGLESAPAKFCGSGLRGASLACVVAAFTRSAKVQRYRERASGDRAAFVNAWLGQLALINAIASK